MHFERCFPDFSQVRSRNPPHQATDFHGTIFLTQSIIQHCKPVIAGILWVALSSFTSGEPVISSDYKPNAAGEFISDDGTVNLSWSDEKASTGQIYLLEQSEGIDFQNARPRYRGPDTASVLTGLREGDYYFRVRRIDQAGNQSDWSKPLELKVRYLDRPTLYLLLSVGALVAGSTIFAITFGFLKNR